MGLSEYTMSDRPYVFSGIQATHEQERLEAVQLVFDPATHHCLEQIGIDAGWTCLEVGAGAGSIMHWLCDCVGESGQVVAIDIEPRFIEGTQRSNLEIRQLDIVTTELEPNFYDLVHVRAVLMHISDRDTAFQHLTRALKPGGWLLVEEPDFANAMPADTDTTRAKSVARVFEATRKLYEMIGADPYLGRKLPLILQHFNLCSINTSVNTALFQGQSLRAKIWKMALESIGQRLIDIELCSSTDIEQFIKLTNDPTAWILDYTIISVWGQKPE